MDFYLSEEQQLIKKMARDYGKEQLEPQAAELDRAGIYPAEIIREMAGLDFMGMFFPMEYGGADADFLSYILLVEELSRSCASIGAILTTHCSLAAHPIFKWGNKEQKEKYLPGMCAGEKLGGFALAEPGAALAAGPDRLVARRDGEKYILNGKKYYVANGGVADIYIVFAQTNPDDGLNGMSVFIVEDGTPGVIIKRQNDKMGLRAFQTAEIVFENAQIPESNRLGAENRGKEIYMDILAGSSVAAAAQIAGIAQAALDASANYAKERNQFGGPIGNLQAVQWMLAEMAMKIYLTRIAAYRVATLIDAGKPYAHEAAMTKMYAAKAGVDICLDAVQIHGGYGYGKEMNVERLLRDVKGITIFDSSNEYPQKIIADELLR